MELAPVGLSVYARVHHVKQTVQALIRNRMASESTLYVFSDAPQPGDERKVKQVRKFLRTIEGFKNINIIERTDNSRVKNNRNGIKMMIDKHGKMIFLEEDVITTPNFLEYMNQALVFYKDDLRIMSISGYSPLLKIPSNYRNDIYLSPRFAGWGFGIWKDRYDLIDMKIKDFDSFICNKEVVKKYKKRGEDLLPLLKLEVEGKIDALDVKIDFQQFQKNMFSIAPVFPLTKNIGHDGSGVHCKKTKKFEVELNNRYKNFSYIPNIQLDPKIAKSLYNFWSGGFKGKLGRLAIKTGIFDYIASLKQ